MLRGSSKLTLRAASRGKRAPEKIRLIYSPDQSVPRLHKIPWPLPQYICIGSSSTFTDQNLSSEMDHAARRNSTQRNSSSTHHSNPWLTRCLLHAQGTARSDLATSATRCGSGIPRLLGWLFGTREPTSRRPGA